MFYIYLLRAIRGFEHSSSDIPTKPTCNCVPGTQTSLCMAFLGLSGLMRSQEFKVTIGAVVTAPVRLFIFDDYSLVKRLFQGNLNKSAIE